MRKDFSGLADRLTILIKCLGNRTRGECAGDHHHSHFRQRSMPEQIGPRTRQSSGGIARDGCRPPKPLFEEMIGQVLQPGLHAPIIFPRHEDKGIGCPNPVRKRLHRLWRRTRGIFLVHPVEHRQSNRLGIDQLGVFTASPKPGHDKVGKPNSQTIGPVRAVEDENPI